MRWVPIAALVTVPALLLGAMWAAGYYQPVVIVVMAALLGAYCYGTAYIAAVRGQLHTLRHPPKPNTRIVPFRLVVGGQLVWQYPAAEFIFMPSEHATEPTEAVRLTLSLDPASLLPKPRAKSGPKPNPKYPEIKARWQAAQGTISQDDFAKGEGISVRTLRRIMKAGTDDTAE